MRAENRAIAECLFDVVVGGITQTQAKGPFGAGKILRLDRDQPLDHLCGLLER